MFSNQRPTGAESRSRIQYKTARYNRRRVQINHQTRLCRRELPKAQTTDEPLRFWACIDVRPVKRWQVEHNTARRIKRKHLKSTRSDISSTSRVPLLRLRGECFARAHRRRKPCRRHPSINPSNKNQRKTSVRRMKTRIHVCQKRHYDSQYTPWRMKLRCLQRNPADNRLAIPPLALYKNERAFCVNLPVDSLNSSARGAKNRAHQITERKTFWLLPAYPL